jgi:hypothetical protein
MVTQTAATALERQSREDQDDRGEREALEPLEVGAEWRARDIADRSRWTYRLTDDARRHPGVPAITAAQREAFDLLDRMCHNPDFNVFMDLQPGDMQFINNYHVLHARTAFQDHSEPARKRFLKRLWLETRKLTERPPQFQLAGSNKAWWARKRTKAS